MKKLSFIFALVVLALFTQCKKQDPTQDTPTNGIQMVLKADNGGSRTSFGPDGAIAWSANDKIYVVANGQCVGHVTNGAGGGSTFTGTLSGITASGTYDFHYYYVGTEQTIADEATLFTMDFSDQDGTLVGLGKFHVGYGTQTGVEVTPGETVTAQATMKTLVAMAYFDIAGMAEAGEKVFFYGDHINNQMTIDFSTNTPAFGKVNEEGLNYLCAGTVTEGATSPCYVMLLPNHTDGTEELATDISFVSKRTTGTCNDVFNYGIIGGRFYCADGDADTPIALTVAAYDDGALRGEFSVSASQTVRFSQGNLQYQGSTSTWRFAENQWNFVGGTDSDNVSYGNVSGSSNNNISQYYSGWIDLFGWGTSGKKQHWQSKYYRPWNTEYASDNTVEPYYGPYGSQNLDVDSDWGRCNGINNGGNTSDQWRTPTKDEWVYVCNTRNTASGIRYAKAQVNDVNGLILLPDDWSDETYPLNSTNTGDASFDSNVITASQWLMLESAGAVFLPAAGDRGFSPYGNFDRGMYWSATTGPVESNSYRRAYYLWIYAGLNPEAKSVRCSGLSVRLVHR